MSAWSQQGFQPSEFWKSTPREFNAIMAGRSKAHDSATESAYFQAWATERFAREKILKPFGKYAADLKPKKPQTGQDILAIFQGFAASGIGVKIEKVK